MHQNTKIYKRNLHIETNQMSSNFKEIYKKSITEPEDFWSEVSNAKRGFQESTVGS